MQRRHLIQLAAGTLAAPALARAADDKLRELRLDYATYSPSSLVLKRFGWLDEDFKSRGIPVKWVFSAGSNRALEYLNAGSIDIGSSAGLAALLQRHWPAERVVLCGPLAQAVLVLVITQSQQFAPYAAAASVFAAVMIFTHTFAFGLLARLDPSGRALAATPAMMMAGAALGPVLGGTLVKWAGYESLAVAAVLTAACAVACFSQARQRTAAHPAQPA